jgi:L-threonylcarbamoyladenylate synthase
MNIISTDISKAVAILNAEGLVAIPTETVYGLAGNIFSKKAIKLIFEIKKRPFFNPLIVHIKSVDELLDIVSYVPEKAKLLANAFWPGPLTLVLPKNSNIPDIITAGKDTVAVRIPNHPMALELLQQLDFPLAAPSANPFGNISPTTAQHVNDYFKDAIQMVLDGGACERGIESTIIGFDGDQPVLYRLGSTSTEAIEAVVGPIEIMNKKEIAPEAPGMLERHYAPSTITVLVNDISEELKKHKDKRIGVLAFHSKINHDTIAFQIIVSENKDLLEAASKLYGALHQLDKQNLDLIIVERFPDFGLGKTINDRLQRATVKA